VVARRRLGRDRVAELLAPLMWARTGSETQLGDPTLRHHRIPGGRGPRAGARQQRPSRGPRRATASAAAGGARRLHEAATSRRGCACQRRV